MLDVVIVLVIIALVLLFLRAGRQNTIVYRKKVAPRDRGYSISDHPSIFSPPPSSDHYAGNQTESGYSTPEALAFGGGEFGGGGAGDSYDINATDAVGDDFNDFTAGGSNTTFNDSDFSSCDSDAGDSGDSDSCPDSSNDNSGYSSD